MQCFKQKANGKGVMGKRIEETEWKFYPSLRNASRALGVADCNIGHVCRGREKQAKGYVFRYATPSEVKKFGEYEKE